MTTAFHSIDQTFERKLPKNFVNARLMIWNKLNFRFCERRDEQLVLL